MFLLVSLSSEDTHFKKLEIQPGTNQTTRLYSEVLLKRPPSSRTKTGLSSEAVLITRAKTYFNWLFGTEKMWSEQRTGLFVELYYILKKLEIAVITASFLT